MMPSSLDPPHRANPGAEVAPVLEARDLHKRYIGGDGTPLDILCGVDLAITAGRMVAIVGESGSGKSTLLHLLGTLDRPTRGEVLLGGRPLSGRPDGELAELRNRHIGFVF